MTKKLSDKEKVQKIQSILESGIPGCSVYALPVILKKVLKVIYDIEEENTSKI